MGMFSWECKGCNQELVTGEMVRLNGSRGEYDGYGGLGGCNCEDYDPAAWHQKCYSEATDAEKLDDASSKPAMNQGFGFPRADCMPEGSSYVEPPRVKYAEVRKDDILEYLTGLYDEDQAKGAEGYWFFFDGRAPDRRESSKRFAVTDIADEDFESMRNQYGDRFAHDHMDDEEKERKFWGDYDPGDHFWNMREKFQGRHNIVSELAHEVLGFAKKRLG